MMLRSIFLWLLVLCVGILIGGLGMRYWNEQMRKAESALALHEANTAVKKATWTMPCVCCPILRVVSGFTAGRLHAQGIN